MFDLIVLANLANSFNFSTSSSLGVLGIIIIVRVLGWDYILKLSKYYLWKILLSLRCTHYFAEIHHFTNRMMLLSPDKSATLFRSANTCYQVSFSKTFHVGNLKLYILTYQ
ncbi:hypothetical protein DERF_008937 [Dermatophagoides farinae]|uniref:Uncharacterized protein n=1 Tax=Dermatophagoides farinae TaxID=6954 RepID=A0A922HTV6_DERFA|nr:hypothetical protein DERF_008937 [Dermatophagoides farinae]